MPNSLIIFLLILGIISFFLIHKMVKKRKMLVSHAIIWDGLVLLIMMASLSTSTLKKIATLIGIEEVSNLIFFMGFIFLLVINLILTINISKQKSAITTLVQQLALTNNRLEHIDDSINKKDTRKI